MSIDEERQPRSFDESDWTPPIAPPGSDHRSFTAPPVPRPSRAKLPKGTVKAEELTRKITIKINVEEHRALTMRAFDNETSIQEEGRKAIQLLLRRS